MSLLAGESGIEMLTSQMTGLVQYPNGTTLTTISVKKYLQPNFCACLLPSKFTNSIGTI